MTTISPAMYKKPPKMSHWDSFKHTLTNFLLASTIHGLRYWYEGRNWFEKLVWILAVLGCFGIASYMIKTNLDEGFEDPILTTLHTTSGERNERSELQDPDNFGHIDQDHSDHLVILPISIT